MIAVLCSSGVVSAEDDESEQASESSDSESSDPESRKDGQGGDADAAATAPSEAAAATPTEAPTWWFGAYVQGAWVPSFMLKLFLDEAPTVGNVGFGVTAAHRDKHGFSLVFGLGYASYAFDGPFRIKGDPEQDTEYLSSTLGLLHLRGQMVWSTDLVPNTLSFEYGFGLDIGLVLGQLKRNEAFRATPGADFQPCSGPLAPATLSPAGLPYCEPPAAFGSRSDAYNAHGAHYDVVEKRVPPVALVPMLPVLALRYTPVRELAIKLDAAFGLLQFAVGVSAAYGVDL
jgi:hypothetical protein